MKENGRQSNNFLKESLKRIKTGENGSLSRGNFNIAFALLIMAVSFGIIICHNPKIDNGSEVKPDKKNTEIPSSTLHSSKENVILVLPK